MNKNPINFLIDGGRPIVNLSTEADDTSKVVTKKVGAVVSAYLKLYTEILAAGIPSGEFSEQLNAEEYAMKMFASIEGAGAISRVMNSTRPMQLITRSLKKELNSYSLIPGETVET
jgi:TetR/AcrR family transcriptional repressor of nem operon